MTVSFWSHNRLSSGGFIVSKTNNDMYSYSPQLQKVLEMERIYECCSLVGFTRKVYILVCFPMSVYAPFSQKAMGSTLLFTPIPSKSSFRLTSYLDNRLSVYGTLKVARFSKRVSVHRWSIVISTNTWQPTYIFKYMNNFLIIGIFDRLL